MSSYKFYTNKECRFFPCHKGIEEKRYNCKLCFCPLYSIDDCGGNYKILDNGTKDCSQCLYPHKKENYDEIMEKLKRLM